MNKTPTPFGDRPPLKDTSKKFINTPRSSKLLAAPSLSIKKIYPLQQIDEKQQQQQQQPIVHVQKLNTSDRTPCLIDTSTPKKDGYLPSLTTRTNNNSIAIVNSMSNNLHNDNNNINNMKNNGTTATTTHTTNSNTIVKKMTGNELSKWQQTWREILPKSFVYFEQDDSNERDKRKAMIALKKLGATIEPFFCENITIIISKRPYNKSIQYPKGDIFKYAAKKQLKVWNIEKVFRFLNHLGEPIPDLDEYDKVISLRNTNNVSNINNNQITNNTQLSNLLMNERLFGPSDRDPNVRRNDFKYFTDFYLYIYDISHKTRPVAIREWKDKFSCPRMHHTTNGKSLFVPEAKSQNPINILKRHQRRLQCLNDTFSYREIVIESSYDETKKNNLQRHPTYEERISFKRKWEEIYYKNYPDEAPFVKLRTQYLSLNPNDKKMFKHMFEDNTDNEKSKNINNNNNNNDDDSIMSRELIDLSSSVKRRKVETKITEHVEHLSDQIEKTNFDNNNKSQDAEIINELDDHDINEQPDSKNNKDTGNIKYIAEISDNKQIISKNEKEDEVNVEAIEEDKNEENNANRSTKKDGDINTEKNEIERNANINEGKNHNDTVREKNNENNESDSDIDISNLISDKIDVIDEINNHLVNQDNKIDDKNDQLSKLSRSKKMPKLMRQDSLINGMSQNISGDGKLLCEYGEIVASGIQASGVNPSGTCSHGNTACNIGNGLGPSKSQVVNKTLVNEHKRIVVLTPLVNNRPKNRDLATMNTTTNKTKVVNSSNKENEKLVTVMVADETIPEEQDEVMVGYKESSNKNTTTINEDELAALRSVEAANPFLSDKYSKQYNNTNSKVKNNVQNQNNLINNEKLGANKNIKLCNKNLKDNNKNIIENENSGQSQKKNNTVTLGVFKEQKQEKSKHELRPGYCENCRVKYSDFSDHIVSEKHRSFAQDDGNFKQIDNLIKLLDSVNHVV